MLEETIATVSRAAEKKRDLIHSSFLRYFVLAMLAGIYVGFGILLIFTIGASFAVALFIPHGASVSWAGSR
jgi:nitrite transporter NirC